jgi:hypothetical protein
MLSRLVKAGELVRIGRGIYRSTNAPARGRRLSLGGPRRRRGQNKGRSGVFDLRPGDLWTYGRNSS